MLRTILSAILAGALSVSAVATAAAAPASDTTSMKVRIADLDLGSEPGARVALQRIRQAARTICGAEPDSRSLERQTLHATCVRDVVDRTVASADRPALTAVNGGPVVTTTLASAK